MSKILGRYPDQLSTMDLAPADVGIAKAITEATWKTEPLVNT
jgi:hypothetical protein